MNITVYEYNHFSINSDFTMKMLRQKLSIYTKSPLYTWSICRPICIAICLFCIVPIANAQIYKWVDKDGTVHYSQEKPPAEIASEDVLTLKAPAKFDSTEALEALENQQKEHAELSEARVEEKTAAKEQKEAEQARQQRCEQSKARLASYLHPRVRVEDADGNVKKLGEEERQAEIAKSNEYIKEHCGE